MLLKRPGLAAGLVGLVATQAGAPGLRVEHTPPACLLADRPSRLVACLAPRVQHASLRVSFRAEGDGAWYSAPLRSDTPCYAGLLPRPNRATARVFYFIEAEDRDGVKARTTEQQVAVVTDPASCPGRVAPTAPGQRATWDAPAGEPRVPPGFEGAAPPPRSARAAAAPPPTMPPLAPSKKETPPRPAPRPVASPAAPATPPPTASGGHGRRNAALVTVGLAAAGGTAVAVTRKDDGGTATPPPPGTGLPATGVSGVYVGTETVTYTGGCVGTDDVVLNLQENGGALSGVLTFTVRSCACCSSGRGANPVAGSLSGTSVQLATPIGFSYSGSFAGNRLSGSLAGPGGVAGSWSVDKR